MAEIIRDENGVIRGATLTPEEASDRGKIGGKARAAKYAEAKGLLVEMGLDSNDTSLKTMARQAMRDGPGALSAMKHLRQVAGLDSKTGAVTKHEHVVQLSQRTAHQLLTALNEESPVVQAVRLNGEQVMRVDHENGSLWVTAEGKVRNEPVP